MSWSFYQNNGAVKDPDGYFVTFGYSGHGPGVNNPDMENQHGTGPIPCGSWVIGPPENSPNTGPYSLPLSPEAGTNTFGRSAFLIHGDLVGHEGEHIASHGCIIMDHSFRERIWQSGDHILDVVSYDEDATPVA